MTLIPYSVAFLVAIANTAISTLASVDGTAIGLTNNQLWQRSRTKSISPMRRGRLTCVESNGTIHRVSATFNGDESAATTPGRHRKDVLVVEFDPDAATKGMVNLAIVPVVTWKTYFFIGDTHIPKPYLGVIPCSSRNSTVGVNKLWSVTLGPFIGTCAVLGTVTETRLGAIIAIPPPQFTHGRGHSYFRVTKADVFTQSAIWTFDPKTMRLTPHWVNLDNSTATLRVFYDSKISGFGMTGDIKAFQSLYYPVSECDLTFTPI